MLPLFDMLTRAQNGDAVETMARQLNLSQQQTRAAMEALLPAFSQGLRRNAADPYGVGAFLNALSSGQHAKYFDDAGQAFAPEGIAEGNGILGHLFGSKELSRTVAAQASQASGVAEETLKHMLPAMASMIMGGLFKQSTNQIQSGGFGSGGNAIGEIIEQMMRQGGATGMRQPHYEAPQPQANPFDNPFGQALEGMFGGQRGREAPQAPQSPYGDNPFGRIFEEMMGGGRSAPAQPEPEPENPSGRPRNPYDDLFGQMFDTGRKTRDDYQKNMESTFDQFLSGMNKYK